ncbi:MAG: nitroreductase/quinone reductase family protein [Anaerolineaceae bacterium]|nr:nitroreductase/quinone reductase family protein [Anaerolineaceae bacterium]
METLLTLFSPRSALVRALYRLPLLLWRMGLGWMLPRSMLVLSTRGRVSGLPRHTMLEQFVHKGQIVVGSAWGDRSQWARNLAASDVVSTETWSGGVTRARARAIRDETVLADLRKSSRMAAKNLTVGPGFRTICSGTLKRRTSPRRLP